MASSIQDFGDLPGIPPDHLHSFFEAIHGNTAPRHVGKIGLNLQSRHLDPGMPEGQQKADHAAPGSEFEDPILFFRFDEMGQQDGVDRVPVTLLLLEDLQPPPEEGLEGFVVPYQGRFRH